jgi:CubicO group peptidase (beta-lactamase class C family)
VTISRLHSQARAVLLLCVSLTAHAGDATGRLFEARIGERDPGCAVLVRHRDHTVMARGYGVIMAGGGDRINARTNFRLASVSKQFTAMAVMLLIRDGRLRYDMPITEVLPEFPAYGRAITIRHLLTHTGGLADYEDLMERDERAGGPSYTPLRQISDAEVLALLKRAPGPLFPPGSQWAYSNSGYVLLGLIVSRVSGVPFATFLHDRIFAPLGMRGTRVAASGEPVGTRAIGHERTAGAFVVSDQSSTSATQGDGGVYSNLEDLARWDHALARHRLLPPSAMHSALTPVRLADGGRTRWPQTPDEDNLAPGEPVSYGYGWFLDPWSGHARSWHFGTTQGFRSAIMRFEKDALSVVVLCNRMDMETRGLALAVAAPYLGVHVGTPPP